MKGLLIIIVVIFFLSGCSLLLPDLLKGYPLSDSLLENLVFINEVSADNPDAADWIEIYNGHTAAVDLSGFYLSDDPLNIFKWKIPDDTFILAKGYLIIICDGSGKGGNASFSLKPEVDQVFLTTPVQGDGSTKTIDTLTTIPLTGTGSYGRATDGGNTWTTFGTPTKGGANS